MFQPIAHIATVVVPEATTTSAQDAREASPEHGSRRKNGQCWWEPHVPSAFRLDRVEWELSGVVVYGNGRVPELAV
jgi:hypothetical protein